MGHGIVCGTCRVTAEAVVRALPADYDELSAAISRQNTALDTPGPPGKPGSKPPINLNIDALRSAIVYTAAVWEAVIRDREILSTRRAGAVRQRYSLVRSVRIIAPRIDMLAALPPIDDYHDGIEAGVVRRDGLAGIRRLLRLHQLTHRTLGQAAVAVRLPGTCPGCDRPGLERELGGGTVHCRACGQPWTYEQYTRWVQLVIAGEVAA